MAKRIRGFETVGDMLRSLAVVGVFVAVILLITLRQTPDRIRSVDAAPVRAAVTDAAPFEAELPGETPSGWTITSARVTLPDARPYSWYVGYSTDTEAFVAVTQIYGDEAETRQALEDAGVPNTKVGTVTIDDATWTKHERPDGARRALVQDAGGPTDDEAARDSVTTVVVGTAPWSVLESVAGALRPAGNAGTSSSTPAATASSR